MMGKLGFIKNLFLIIFLIVGVYFVANFGGTVKNQVLQMIGMSESDVKGTSTQKAEEISTQISSNVTDHVEDATNNLLQVSIADALNGLSRLQKIPQDIGNTGEYLKEQVDGMLQSREEKHKKREKKDQ